MSEKENWLLREVDGKKFLSEDTTLTEKEEAVGTAYYNTELTVKDHARLSNRGTLILHHFDTKSVFRLEKNEAQLLPVQKFSFRWTIIFANQQ